MLALTRKADEKVKIGNGITITVVQVNGGAVKLGVEAPEDVNISREEIAKEDGERFTRRHDELYP